MNWRGEQKGWLFWAFLLSAAFNLAFLAAFGVTEYRARRACGMEACGERGAGAKLTAQEREALEKSRAKLEASLAPLRARMAEHCRKISEIMASPEPSMAAVQSETAAMAELQRQVQNLILENYIKERASLPDEQRSRFDSLLRQRLCGAGACGMAARGQACEGASAESREDGPERPKTK